MASKSTLVLLLSTALVAAFTMNVGRTQPRPALPVFEKDILPIFKPNA